MEIQKQHIKEKIKERYRKIALTGNSDCCCVPGECCNDSSQPSAKESTEHIGYDREDIDCIPEASILGVGCGAPTKFAGMREGEPVVDLGSWAGIDVFLTANKVGKSGMVNGVDMTHEMLEKARKNANDNGYTKCGVREGRHREENSC